MFGQAFAGRWRDSRGNASWTSQLAAKPVETVAFEFASIPSRKITLMAVISEEGLDAPGADTLVRQSLESGVVQTGDTTFVSADAEDPDVSPAGIGADAIEIASSGSSVSAIATDLHNMIEAKVGNVSLDSDVWIMSSQCRAFLRMLKITDADGTLGGFPILASSAANGQILLLSPSYVFLASGPVTLNVSTEANVTIGGTVYSLFQKNLVGIVSEFWLNWVLGGPSDSTGHFAAVRLTSATYV